MIRSITVHKLQHTIPFITHKFWSLSTICRENMLLEYSSSSKLLSVARTKTLMNWGWTWKLKSIFMSQNKMQQPVTLAGVLVAQYIAQHNKLFSGGGFVDKEYVWSRWRNWGSSVVRLGHCLNNCGIRAWVPVGGRIFFMHPAFWAHPGSYSMDTGVPCWG